MADVYNPELKPCPFCGLKAVICKKQYDGYDRQFAIRCNHCACRTPWLYYLDDAAKVWNRRAGNG